MTESKIMNKLADVSMNGRMAYTIMCVEAYLVSKYPDRDWTIVSREMWKATNEYWDIFYDAFCELLPEIFLTYDSYNEDLAKSISEEEFKIIKQLYAGITTGSEDESNDEFAQMIRKPFDFCMAYEGTGIGDGSEGYAIIKEAEKILTENGIPLPDYHKVEFSSYTELNGWGNDFDGRPLSVILGKTESLEKLP